MKGSLDEVRIYDVRISPDEIKTLPLLWYDIATGLESEVTNEPIVFPNPGMSEINISSPVPIQRLDVCDSRGRKIRSSLMKRGEGIFRVETGFTPGVFILRIETVDKVFYRKVVIN